MINYVNINLKISQYRAYQTLSQQYTKFLRKHSKYCQVFDDKDADDSKQTNYQWKQFHCYLDHFTCSHTEIYKAMVCWKGTIENDFYIFRKEVTL